MSFYIKKLGAILCAAIFILSISFVPVFAAPYKEHKIGAGQTVIEAEDFDTDDWHDTGGDANYVYRPDGAQTEYCENLERDDTDESNYNIGWTADGEWVQYTVNVETAGKYTIGAWLASQPATGGVEVFYDGRSIGTAYAEESFDWQDWGLYTVGQVDMTAGEHVIKVELTVSVNLDALVITPAGNEQSAVNIIADCTCEHDFNVIIDEYMQSVKSDADNAGYAAAQDLSEFDTLYAISAGAVVIAVIAIAVAVAAIIFAVMTAKKIKT